MGIIATSLTAQIIKIMKALAASILTFTIFSTAGIAQAGCLSIGNTIDCDEGPDYTIIGDRAYGDNGSYLERRGDTVYDDNGRSYTDVDTIGCQTIGSYTTC